MKKITIFFQPAEKKARLSEQDIGSPKINEEVSGFTSDCSELPKLSKEAVPMPDISETPHQPANFKFPVHQMRSCQANWFNQWTFLHYVEDKDAVICHTCASAVKKKLLIQDDFKEKSFLIGFRNWKKGVEKIKEHEKTDVHKLSLERLINLKQTPVICQLNSAAKEEQLQNFKCLSAIISSLRYLAVTGQAIRGKEHKGGNLMELLEERSMDIPGLRQWIGKRSSWLSCDVQNEIIEIMAHRVLRSSCEEIRKSPFFSLIVDSSTDVSRQEHLSIIIRYVDSGLSPKESFLGLYNPPDTSAKTLTVAIEDTLIRHHLSLDKLRGQCYDGAANMSGRHQGVQQQIAEKQPRATYVHCCNHALDLVLQEVSRECPLIFDCLSLVRDVVNVINESPKRQGIFMRHCDQTEKPVKLKALCPTRWCVRASAMARVLKHYDAILNTLQELQGGSSLTPDMRSKVNGCVRSLKRFDICYGIHLCYEIFAPAEAVASSLQAQGMTISEAIDGIHHLRTVLQKKRDLNFVSTYNTAFEMARRLNLDKPKPPRLVKPPKRLEYTPSPTADTPLSPEDHLRRLSFSVVDLVDAELARRFSSPGLKQLANLEGLLLSQVSSQREVEQKLGEHLLDLDATKLYVELSVLQALFKEDQRPTNTLELAKIVAKNGRAVQVMLPEVIKACSLFLCIPATASSAERSFSTLKLLKTCLRNSMSQQRLTHLMVCKVHADTLKGEAIESIAEEFIGRVADRSRVFGSPLSRRM